MPKICQLTKALSICIYADDHMPPHFHLDGPDTAALIRIDNLRVIAGSYRRHDLALAVAWSAENMDMLWRNWKQLNERG